MPELAFDPVGELDYGRDVVAPEPVVGLRVHELVDRLEQRDAPSGTNNAVNGRERRRLIGDVDEYRPCGDDVNRLVRNHCEVLGTRLDEPGSAGKPALAHGALGPLEQILRDVRKDDASCRPNSLQSTKSKKPIATADIKNGHAIERTSLVEYAVPNRRQLLKR